ncbi:GtrA family protein [Sporosarcina sp. CAU 1771]
MHITNREFLKFIVVGGVNSIVYYICYLIEIHVFGFHYLLAHTIAVLISVCGSFFLNSYYTYKVKPTWRKFFLFPLTQVVNLLVTALFLFFLVDLFQMDKSLAPIAAVVITIPITFFITSKVLKSA